MDRTTPQRLVSPRALRRALLLGAVLTVAVSSTACRRSMESRRAPGPVPRTPAEAAQRWTGDRVGFDHADGSLLMKLRVRNNSLRVFDQDRLVTGHVRLLEDGHVRLVELERPQAPPNTDAKADAKAPKADKDSDAKGSDAKDAAAKTDAQAKPYMALHPIPIDAPAFGITVPEGVVARFALVRHTPKPGTNPTRDEVRAEAKPSDPKANATRSDVLAILDKRAPKRDDRCPSWRLSQPDGELVMDLWPLDKDETPHAVPRRVSSEDSAAGVDPCASQDAPWKVVTHEGPRDARVSRVWRVVADRSPTRRLEAWRLEGPPLRTAEAAPNTKTEAPQDAAAAREGGDADAADDTAAVTEGPKDDADGAKPAPTVTARTRTLSSLAMAPVLLEGHAPLVRAGLVALLDRALKDSAKPKTAKSKDAKPKDAKSEGDAAPAAPAPEPAKADTPKADDTAPPAQDDAKPAP